METFSDGAHLGCSHSGLVLVYQSNVQCGIDRGFQHLGEIRDAVVRSAFESIRRAVTMKLLQGLPPYGASATAFPAEWGCLGREGTVVEFLTGEGSWVANFQPGPGGI